MSESQEPVRVVVDMTGHLGSLAFDAYNKTPGIDGKNFRGEPTPPFETLPEHIQQGWHNGARAIAEMILKSMGDVQEAHMRKLVDVIQKAAPEVASDILRDLDAGRQKVESDEPFTTPGRFVGLLIDTEGNVADTFGYASPKVAVGTLIDVIQQLKADGQVQLATAEVSEYDADGNVRTVYNALEDDEAFTAGNAIAHPQA